MDANPRQTIGCLIQYQLLPLSKGLLFKGKICSPLSKNFPLRATSHPMKEFAFREKYCLQLKHGHKATQLKKTFQEQQFMNMCGSEIIQSHVWLWMISEPHMLADFGYT